MTWVVVAVVLAAVVVAACFGGARSRLRRAGDRDHGERAETARRLQQQIDEGRHTGGGWIS
ncbi:hypothetical protein [Kineococcus aurantiacus]|uniref:Uncharacterized protein n=1 Tax=Kineococcus aurantiacus TaxID=37633 RepID=A0A7Y9DHL1_9ACTN|nr:hypothetical protein [Kineococcus aurantiacus]NYD20485.1 hypothetical protein [Kineococcus aurantiacus]